MMSSTPTSSTNRSRRLTRAQTRRINRLCKMTDSLKLGVRSRPLQRLKTLHGFGPVICRSTFLLIGASGPSAEVLKPPTKRFERIEYAMVTGSFCAVGATTPAEAGYTPGDPNPFDEAVKDDASGWSASIMEEQKSFETHKVFEWVDVPMDA